MLLNAFKVAGFKVFGETVELKMKVESKNTTKLEENLIENEVNGLIYKNLKTSMIYGGNNTGKSSLLSAIVVFKKIFKKGDLEKFPFEIYKNFCFEYDDVIRFEIDFNDTKDNYIYGIEFKDEDKIGEYLFVNDHLIFSRDLNNDLEGKYLNMENFSHSVKNLPNDKLIIPYFLEYQKDLKEYQSFKKIQQFFDKITYIDNGKNEVSLNTLLTFMKDLRKVNILNKLISSTELYLEGRKIISEKDLLNDKFINTLFKDNDIDTLTDDGTKNHRDLVETLRVTSVYRGLKGELVNKPSLLFDSVGTDKYIRLSMNIINALLDQKILLIDEFDSSLHHKLTRVLVILMNSEANVKSQFIMTTHDVNLLSNSLFRKDQINFIIRKHSNVDIISLDDFKANTGPDVRNSSNFERMYVEERIVPLPETNIYEVIEEITNE